MSGKGNNKMQLRHLAIVTLDPDRLAKFYCDVFGMSVLHKEKSGNTFETDGTITLALLRNRAQGKPNGINHMGFHIHDREELDRKLKAWNLDLPVARPDDRPYAEVRMTDPDGNNIDLSLHGFDRVETNVDREKESA